MSMSMASAVVTDAGGLFDTIMGLPVHPLVVHFAVVLLPLSAIGLIIVMLRPTWRTPFGYLALGGLLVGGGATLAAKESGEALADRVGLPQQHANLGSLLTYLAFALIVSALAWFIVAGARGSRWWVTMVLAIVTTALAVAVSILTVVVGHTGATAAWASRISDTASADQPSAAPSLEPSPAPAATSGSALASSSPSTPATTSAAPVLTMADVAKHATPGDCWAAIDGSVYDLTSWISRHPGGPGVIKRLCGTDGSRAFNGQHGGQRKPARELANFLVGPLAP